MATSPSLAVPVPREAGVDGPLAIICGGGALPVVVAQAAQRHGRDVVLFPIRGWADPATVAPFRHHWLAPVQAGRLLRLMRAEGCRDIVFIGSALRPPLRSLRLDWGTLRWLTRIVASYRGGDDRLLSAIARALESEGFRVVGAHEVAPEILMPAGSVGGRAPSTADQADIARGLELLHALGGFDVGQAVIVANGQVLAVEAVDGTDNMLAHVAALRERGRVHTPRGVGVLVKAPKAGQDRRIDLPAIGPKTVEGVAAAGLAGIAVVAGSAIIAEADKVTRMADAANVFVCGIEDRASS
jgi:DUF1009 family protein